MKKIMLLLVACLVMNSFFSGCKKDEAVKPSYKTLLLGKWMWYKTVTGGNAYFNVGMFKEFTANGKVITTDGSGAIPDTQTYFISGNKLAETYHYGTVTDTSWSDIVTCTAGAFSIFHKDTITSVSPPAIVDYWHFFVK